MDNVHYVKGAFFPGAHVDIFVDVDETDGAFPDENVRHGSQGFLVLAAVAIGEDDGIGEGELGHISGVSQVDDDDLRAFGLELANESALSSGPT